MIEYLIELIRCALLLALVPIVFILFVVPLFIMLFPQYGQYIFFLNFRKLPMADYRVSSNNVTSMGREFYLNGRAGKLGVWHILPQKTSSNYREHGIQPSAAELEKTLADDDNKVIFYVHGNSFDRTFTHRIEMYNLLSANQYHVIAFDYRGFGDSDGQPTEQGIVEDTHTVYQYVKGLVGDKTIIVWGHSMGTGVSSKMVMDLSLRGTPPTGLILESPFNNLHDAMTNHFLFAPYVWMPEWIIQKVLIEPMNSVGLIMESDKRIAKVTCPILILHAEDDEVIPIKLARRLRDAASASKRNIEHVEFGRKFHYAHKFICRAPELPGLVSNFITKCEQSTPLPIEK